MTINQQPPFNRWSRSQNMFEPSSAGFPLQFARYAKLQFTVTNDATPTMNPKRPQVTEYAERLKKIGLSLTVRPEYEVYPAAPRTCCGFEVTKA